MVWYHDGVSLRLLWRCCARGPYAQQAAKLCTGMSVVTIYNNNNNNSSFDLPRKIMCVVLYVSFLRAFPVVGVCARAAPAAEVSTSAGRCQTDWFCCSSFSSETHVERTMVLKVVCGIFPSRMRKEYRQPPHDLLFEYEEEELSLSRWGFGRDTCGVVCQRRGGERSWYCC